MPVYNVTFVYADGQNREGRKTYKTQTLADFAAAVTAAGLLYTDFAAIVDAQVLRYTISGDTVVADAGGATANKDEGVTIQVRKTNSLRDILRVPAPVTGLLDGNGNLDTTNALVTDFVDNFKSDGDFTFSDGELAVEIVGGWLDD